MNDLRRRALDFLLGVAVFLGTVLLVAATWRFSKDETYELSALYVYLGCYLVAWFLLVVRRIPENIRALLFLLALYVLSLYTLRSAWLGGAGRAFLLTMIVCTAVLFEARYAILAALLSLVSYAGLALAFTTKWLALPALPSMAAPFPVATEGFAFLLAVGIVTLGLGFVGRAVSLSMGTVKDAQQAHQLLDQRADELDRANQLLAERTASAESSRQEAEAARRAIEAEAWQSTAQAALGQVMGGEQGLASLSAGVIRQLCHALEAQVGVLFVMEEDDTLRLLGSYAYGHRKHATNRFRLGEGLVGQAALEGHMITFSGIPGDYLPAVSSLLQVMPTHIVVAPFLFDGQVLGVVELGLLNALSPIQSEFLQKALVSIGVAFNTARTRGQVNALLMQTQEQAASLQAREDALKAINEELRAQSESLRASQEQLRQQQSILEATNAELEEQRGALDQQNRTLKIAQQQLQARTEELSIANKYKSEFLANMSHELRTPLNSLLILARMLASNEEKNLSDEQVESARVIYQSGSDLLLLINEILDLSKIEAGRMTFDFANTSLANVAESMRSIFAHIAEERGLLFEMSLSDDLPQEIETDQQRVEQIVKNLLSNAFKFTEKGSIHMRMELDAGMVAVRVSDTGIGMTLEQQGRIFDAFQQADGATNRKYGGTGLGLTISRELAARLGGRIDVKSELGRGSTFSLYLPQRIPANLKNSQAAAPVPMTAAPQPKAPILPVAPASSPVLPAGLPAQVSPGLPDDRANLQEGDKVLLVIEDDPNFSKIVFDYAHKKGFKCLLATTGEHGLLLARHSPPSAILLDLKLPGISGWDVLDELKGDAALRHIPVHILSVQEETLDAYKRGALGFLSKPVSAEGLEGVFQKIGDFLAREIKSLLLIEDDTNLRNSVNQLLSGNDVAISEAASGQQAIEFLRTRPFDCIILDLALPDMTGFDLLNQFNHDETVSKCPVIIYTGKELTEKENAELLKYANSVIIKGVKSPERLLDETALFLHRVVADLPEEKQRAIRRLHDAHAIFRGKHILIVDDDMRNAFALSRLLSDRGLKVSIARSGQKALDMLDENPEMDLVLMDIMMPDMDGYETMKRIREQQRFDEMPVIALTAKAMRGDRERCLEAGASDYLSKPVDADQLFSMLQVWLYQG
ncbi:MAG: response regulator [Chloroflexota bacterium]